MQERFACACSIKHLVVVIAILLWTSVVSAQTSSFTYQGRLTDGGTSANGNYDLQFALFDSLSGGSQVGSTQTLNTVAVSNGVFTVSLDFGANAFPGASRFLEISARPTTGGAFTLLSPRQQITSTPYAVRSLNATTADTVTLNGTSVFSITGVGNGANSNTFAGLGAGVVTTPANTAGAFNSFFGNQAGQSNTTGSNNSFFGFRAGLQNTTATLNSFFGSQAGATNTTGGGNSFFGMQAGLFNTTGSGNSFFGERAGLQNQVGTQNTALGAEADVTDSLTNATAIGAHSRVNTSNSLVLGSINGINGATADTNVGIGTTVPTVRLHVVGTTGLIGDVGIGTTAPTAKLSVVATGDGARLLYLGTERPWVFRQFGSGAGTALELTGDNPTNPKDFVITGNNVGIGTQGPLDRLHVFGDIRVGTNLNNGCLKNNNGSTIVGTCSSDARFKRNITPFPNLLSKVVGLRPVHFYWRASEFPAKHFGNLQSYGLVAQDVEKVLPELVSEDEQGYKQLDYSKLPLLLLQAIKELKAENDQLKDRLHKVERRLRARPSGARRR